MRFISPNTHQYATRPQRVHPMRVLKKHHLFSFRWASFHGEKWRLSERMLRTGIGSIVSLYLIKTGEYSRSSVIYNSHETLVQWASILKHGLLWSSASRVGKYTPMHSSVVYSSFRIVYGCKMIAWNMYLIHYSDPNIEEMFLPYYPSRKS